MSEDIKNKNFYKDNKIKDFFEKNPFLNFIKSDSEIYKKIFEKILSDNNSIALSLAFNYTNILISKFISENDKDNKNKKIILMTKTNIKKHIYLKKCINEFNRHKKYFCKNEKIISFFSIILLYNIFKLLIITKKKNNFKEYNKIAYNLNNLLKISFNYIEKFYIDNIINDNYFEIILFLLLSFSFSNSLEKITKDKEIINMIFFNGCIYLIKKVFKNIFLLNKEFTQPQEQMINNIILFINNKLVDSFDKLNNMKYINKVYLSKNDYKTSSLIDLSFIISKIKLNEVKSNYIDLLTNIYIFSFEYNNLMEPIIKQLGPLFININKKNINQIEEELNYHDFSLKLLDSLISKELKLSKQNLCLLRQGFYLGNEKSGIIYDISNFDNEICIMFGFKLDSSNSDKVSLFELYNKKEKSSEIKIYLHKTYNDNRFEMFILQHKASEWSTKINIYLDKTYIFLFNFKNGGLSKINYIKDDNSNINKKDFKPNIFSGMEIKLKKFKTDNIRLYLGCEQDSSNINKCKNAFKGFIGDLFIFNKNLKTNINNKIEIEKLLLYLGGNYSSIFFKYLENKKDGNYFFNSNFKYLKEFYNSNFIYFKEKINDLNDNNIKFDSIITFINSNFFKLIEYHDNIDYMNYINNNIYYYTDKGNNQFEIKSKYFDLKNKIDYSEDKLIILGNAYFNKNFHIFVNKFTLLEFIKYDGLKYLYLLLEYYYQIINQLIRHKHNYQINDMDNIFQKINIKINNVLYFFYNIIIENNMFFDFFKKTNRFFCQMSETLQKFLEINALNSDTINFLVKILNCFNQCLNKFLKNNVTNKKYILLRDNIFDFLLNPKLYQKTDKKSLEKLDFVLENLLNKIKYKSSMINQSLNSLLNIDILNKFFAFLWLLDNNKNIIENEDNEYAYKKNLLEITASTYSLILIEFLKFSNQNNFHHYKRLSESSLLNQIKTKSEEKFNSSSKLLKIEINLNNNNTNNQPSFIDFFFDKTLEKKWNSYIFSRMVLILLKSNLVNTIDKMKIEKLKNLFITIIKEKEDNYNDNKRLFLVSCLQILIYYYCSNNDSYAFLNPKNINKREEFHLFIRSLDLNLDLFHSIISSLKILKYFTNKKYDDTDGIAKENEEEKSKDLMIDDLDITVIIKEIKDINLISTNIFPLAEIEIEKLNKIQINIIKTLFGDLIYLFTKYEKQNNLKKDIKNINYNESSESTVSSNNHDTENEMLELFQKNLDIIFNFKKSNLFNEIFDYDCNACSEFFYLKLKLSNKNESDLKIINLLIIKYNQELLRTHSSPFIYKFFLMLSSNNVSLNNIKENFVENETKIFIFTFIIDTLTGILRELKHINKVIFYLYNLINVTIILNNELEKNSKEFFTNIKFIEIFLNYLNLLNQTGLLYSNYYIELEEKKGKIIIEIIFDLFLELSKYFSIEKVFLDYFIKENQQKKEKYTIFYLMDLLKENVLEKDEEIQLEIKKYIPENIYINLKYIHNKFTNKSKQIKFIQNRKLYPIEGINFSIYFLAKIFKYLENKELANELIKLLEESFLPLLLNNIRRLYFKRKNFYGKNSCKKFPIYYKTKSLFEANLNPIKFEKFKNCFKENMTLALKDENDDIKSIYSSRLFTFPKRGSINIHEDDTLLKDFNLNLIEKEPLLEINENIESPKASLDLNSKCYSQNSIHFDESDITKFSDDLLSTEKEEEYISLFSKIKKNNIIYNPKNYFFKISFANVFKNMIFKDKLFRSIKLTYLIKYRKYANCILESKQLDYPIKQKNFSNFLEPSIFLRRDYNYYDKIYFPILHEYIKPEVLPKKEENIFLYPHDYIVKDIAKLNDKDIFCELVTKQFIYFGKMYFTYDFIFFESEKEDPRNMNSNDIELDEIFKYAISTKIKDKNEKQKHILIFCEDIKEIIQRRTLLINQSIEIYNKNGKSFFFNFFLTNEIEQVYKYLEEINNNLYKNNLEKFIFNTNNNKEEIKYLLENYHKGKISNYDYILYLNKYSTRTYNDLSQYPIFPWIINNYEQVKFIFESISNKAININYLRDLNYPICAQTESQRKKVYLNYINEEKEKNFPSHYGTHYSNSAYIFFYLMRINPYSQNLIKLQSFKLEDPDRVFDSFIDISKALAEGSDNRELIPDILCYIDYFINLNCSYFGFKRDNTLSDDFRMNSFIYPYYTNIISSFINSLFNEKKLLNTKYISERLFNWVDLIFGKNQLPKKEEFLPECYNIYLKCSYEQKFNLEKKIEKYQNLYNSNKSKKIQYINKIKNKCNLLACFGMAPKQILTESNLWNGDYKFAEIDPKQYELLEDKYIYFTRLPDNNFLILKKDYKNKTKSKLAFICENKNLKSKEIFLYDCKYMSSLKKRNYINYENKYFSLYKINYAIAFLKIEKNKYFIPFILSCRYFGNYFKIQNNESILNTFCEDFVTCIKEKSYCNKEDNYFFTGLLNGKLIEWKIILINNSEKLRKSKIKNYLTFSVKDVKNIYAHNSSITAIEIYERQNIIITSGKDNYIYIRKIYDFELLASIDLTYSFGNPIISTTLNIFPSSIKISELNLLYVIIYDYDSKANFIRGYNLNGLFFAQTNPKKIIDKNKDCLQINDIYLTKNGNLIAWFYNSNEIKILSAWNLIPIKTKFILNNFNIKYVEYNDTTKELYILYDNEIIIETFKELED